MSVRKINSSTYCVSVLPPVSVHATLIREANTRLSLYSGSYNLSLVVFMSIIVSFFKNFLVLKYSTQILKRSSGKVPKEYHIMWNPGRMTEIDEIVLSSPVSGVFRRDLK